MNSIAPVWDGNETWLILGGVALLAAFPLAFAIILPAVYFPLMLMLLALVFRGVAFEFRFRDAEHRTFWDHGFCYGSALGAFAQGVVLGAFIQGFEVDGRHFVGRSLDCFTPFSLLTGVALMFGYALLGAGWLVLKTEGPLQAMARRLGRYAFLGVLVAVVAVSLWTPYIHAFIAERWFSWPNIAWLAPVPILTALVAFAEWRALNDDRAEAAPFVWAVALFVAVLSRPRDQPVPDDRAVQVHDLAGRLVGEDAGLSARRRARPAAGHPDLLRLVLLGVPRQGAGGHRLSLKDRRGAL